MYSLSLCRGNGAVLSGQNEIKTRSGTVCLKAGDATLGVSGGEESALRDLLESGSVAWAAARSGAGSAGRHLERGGPPRVSHLILPLWSPAPRG